jgi:hypothetical protein
MSESDTEAEPVNEPGTPDDTAPTPSLPPDDPAPVDPDEAPGGPGGPAPDPREPTPGL